MADWYAFQREKWGKKSILNQVSTIESATFMQILSLETNHMKVITLKSTFIETSNSFGLNAIFVGMTSLVSLSSDYHSEKMQSPWIEPTDFLKIFSHFCCQLCSLSLSVCFLEFDLLFRVRMSKLLKRRQFYFYDSIKHSSCMVQRVMSVNCWKLFRRSKVSLSFVHRDIDDGIHNFHATVGKKFNGMFPLAWCFIMNRIKYALAWWHTKQLHHFQTLIWNFPENLKTSQSWGVMWLNSIIVNCNCCDWKWLDSVYRSTEQ